MRSLEQIDADLIANSAEQQRLISARKKHLEQAAQAFDDAHRDKVRELVSASGRLGTEREALLSVTSSHPLEGHLLIRKDLRYSRGYHARAKEVTRRAVVVVIRDYADQPPRKKNVRHQTTPGIGAVIIQLTDAKGTRLTEWESIGNLKLWTVLEKETKHG